MSIKIGINGFGRIGRNLLRISLLSAQIDVVAINDIADIKTCAHLLKYDSVFGVLENNVSHDSDGIIIDEKKIKVFSERNPADINCSDEGCRIVVESPGIFTSKEQASQHLGGNVSKVIISAPAKGDVDFTTVMGANDDMYDNKIHHIISNASCTTNCLAMIVKVLRDNFSCQYCWSNKELTFDHLLPRSKGGKTDWDNVVTACSSCNVKKGGRLLQKSGMILNQKPYQPTTEDLHKNGKNFPPNFLHKSWIDYLYWDVELEP